MDSNTAQTMTVAEKPRRKGLIYRIWKLLYSINNEVPDEIMCGLAITVGGMIALATLFGLTKLYGHFDNMTGVLTVIYGLGCLCFAIFEVIVTLILFEMATEVDPDKTEERR